MKFIHASDLHLDSPLRGLDRYEEAPTDMIRSATRDAVERMIDLAIKEKVTFIVLAGDLADGDWKDSQTMLWLTKQFRRLLEHDIIVYTIRGNHDAQNNLSKYITKLENVKEFPDRPTTFRDDKNRYAIHGQSYPSREVNEDLVKEYPAAIDGVFNIGILHTNLTGTTEHDNYAPTSLDELKSKKYDYWALGHVHKREIVHEYPHIVYPGNTQGRNIRETGEKGCYLVNIDDGHVSNIDFVPLQVVKWEKLDIKSEPEDDVSALIKKVNSGLSKLVSDNEESLTVVRIRIHGPNREHGRLEKPTEIEDFKNTIRDYANSSPNPIWIEKIKLELRAPIDIEALKNSDTLLGDLLRLTGEIGDDPEQLRDLISDDIKVFREKAALVIGKTEKDLDDTDLLRYYLERAESILVSYIMGEGQ
ncbi:MAG: metallophosphoesterase family protein [Candidatus Syntropharchaeia archaeon]